MTATLHTCVDCDGHIFVVVSGDWEVWGANKLRSPVTMLCVGCGRQLFTVTWTGDEEGDGETLTVREETMP